jgi:hypothetical protein
MLARAALAASARTAVGVGPSISAAPLRRLHLRPASTTAAAARRPLLLGSAAAASSTSSSSSVLVKGPPPPQQQQQQQQRRALSMSMGAPGLTGYHFVHNGKEVHPQKP